MSLVTQFIKRSPDKSAPHNRKSGQSMVELAIVMPMLVLMLTGMLEFGRMAYAAVSISQAVRDGARIAMDRTVSDDTIKQRVVDGARPFTVTKSNVTVSNRTAGNAVTVSASYSFDSIVPMIEHFWDGDEIVITRSRVARVQE